MSGFKQFKDGSIVMPSMNHLGKWVAWSGHGGHLLIDPATHRTLHFDTSEDAKLALVARGEADSK